MERRIFTADPRRIAAAEAEILYVSLEIRVRIEALVLRVEVLVPLVIGCAKMASMLGPDMVPPGYANIFRENRRSDKGGQNNYRTQRFHVGHWFSPPGPNPPGGKTFRHQPNVLLRSKDEVRVFPKCALDGAFHLGRCWFGHCRYSG
jgi:hypothetical protein